MPRTPSFITIALSLLAALPADAASYAFDFGGSYARTTPALLTTADGLRVALTSPADPGAFAVLDMSEPFSGLDSALVATGAGGAVLDVAFSAPVERLTFNFLLGDMGLGTLPHTLSVTIGDTTTVVQAAIPPGLLAYAGTVDIRPATPFTHVLIASPYPFGIGVTGRPADSEP